MAVLMYLKHIWQLKTISLLIIIIKDMVVELRQNWKVLLKGFSDRYFFHKLSKRYNERDILDYFVANFKEIDGNKWVGNLINNEGVKIIPDIENIKTHLSAFSGTIAYLLVMTLIGVAFVLMMVFSYMETS